MSKTLVINGFSVPSKADGPTPFSDSLSTASDVIKAFSPSITGSESFTNIVREYLAPDWDNSLD